MGKSNLILFKEKFNLSTSFIETIQFLFDKLIEHGYISSVSKGKFYDRLFNNINEIYIGSENKYDYKSGYYDANKKILYIKDEKDIPAVYLRLLYVITTREVDKNIFITGYGTTKFRLDSYKLDYINFGFNRAVFSNLVYRLFNILPINLKILPTYKTYHHNFLGYDIETTNELYALEGKILSELCFTLGIDEDILYAGIFQNNPLKYLNNILNKKDFKDEIKDNFISLFDSISRTYNTYNKLVFLSKKFNNNYIERKKNALKGSNEDLIKEELFIQNQIRSIIFNLSSNDQKNQAENDNEKNEFDFTESLSETIENLESKIKDNLISIQNLLSDKVIISVSELSSYLYASKLKQFNDMLIVPSEKISEIIKNTIIFKLMPENEITSVNIIQKIKYSIIQEIISEKRFTNISKSFGFYNINNLINEDDGTALIILNANKRFVKLLQIRGLDKKIGDLTVPSPKYIPLDNLKYLISTGYSNIYIGSIEKLFTSLKEFLPELSDVSLENTFIFEYMDKKYLLVYNKENVYVINISNKGNNYTFDRLDLSEYYMVFGSNKNIKIDLKSNLPILYKTKG